MSNSNSAPKLSTPKLVGHSAKLIVNGQWGAGRVTEISHTGARFQAEILVEKGDAIVACISEVGALPGVIEACGDGEVRIAFSAIAADTAGRLSQSFARTY